MTAPDTMPSIRMAKRAGDGLEGRINDTADVKYHKSKTDFVDDEISKGIRYFYRVRAVNRNWQGQWSEPVCRAQ